MGLEGPSKTIRIEPVTTPAKEPAAPAAPAPVPAEPDKVAA